MCTKSHAFRTLRGPGSCQWPFRTVWPHQQRYTPPIHKVGHIARGTLPTSMVMAKITENWTQCPMYTCLHAHKRTRQNSLIIIKFPPLRATTVSMFFQLVTLRCELETRPGLALGPLGAPESDSTPNFRSRIHLTTFFCRFDGPD